LFKAGKTVLDAHSPPFILLRLSGNSFTEGVILASLLENPALLRLLYRDFELHHKAGASTATAPALPEVPGRKQGRKEERRKI
jgi:hypothetical protein